MSDERQTRLEELLAHQQHLIDTLNTEAVEQRKEIDRLSGAVARLEAKLKLLAQFVERSGEDLPHEKPPHY
ncbi:SlyX family protein [Aeoliella sp. ICT_H6.2]|uniref:SlyX family protein n=1 Tax=Aeoliella straminimaris TaxID=2954799 RepID=A0A9X2F619_9BACT|nr:SlyX family protein [Aeoliella straminimaris]MCO6042293.1 SlyX family protein [Aeoliella straminimaris]